MFDWFRNAWNALFNVMQSISIVDIVDILLLSYLLYAVLKLVRETRAVQLMKGIALVVVAYIISDFIGLKAMRFISYMVLNTGLIAIIVLFQPELRRALEKFGQTTFRLSRFTFGADATTVEKWEKAIPAICESSAQLARTCTGALIVIERSTKLGEQILNGTVMKAEPTVELFGNIFYPKTPLHDGAVIMRDGIIWAAACFLPKPQKEELIDKHLGSRHRAAIGMSENSDALIIVVSEETGQISVAQNGVLTRDYTKGMLEQLLRQTLIPPESESGWRPSDLLPFRKKRKTAEPSEPAKQTADSGKEA